MEKIIIHRTVVFSSPDLLGGEAVVVVMPVPPTPELMRLLRVVFSGASSESANAAWCFCWRERETLAVRCYAGGRMIDFCGHGLLACANVWYRRDGQCPTLRSASADYRCALRHNQLWLSTPRVRCEIAEPPRASVRWFDSPAQRGAVAGGAQGYRILEWQAGTDLANLRPNLDAIVRDETRAVIATQAFTAAQRREHGWDFSLRYFAPQYGVAEDSATGSANAVLADYWTGRGLRNAAEGSATWRAKQCSPRGGAIMSRLHGSLVDIGGHFHVIETTSIRLKTAGSYAGVGA